MTARLVLFSAAVLLAAGCSKHEKPQQASPPVASAVVQVKQSENPDKPLAEGDAAPALQAVAHTGQLVKLAGYHGKPVVLYFYPKDDSPGCTIEAQGLRDAWVDLKKHHAVVLGVSADDNVSHRAFASKYDLSFLLLPDTDHKIARAFGVPVKGGHDMRYTFVIGPTGKVAKVLPNVDPRQNAKQVLDALDALSS